MARQYRGCSRLYYASYTYDATTKTITFGAPKQVAPVKAISREMASDSEEVWADNMLNDTTYGGTAITKTFTCVRIDPAVEADLLGFTTQEVGSTTKYKVYGTPADGSARKYFAFGYALHDGDVNKPCEVVWAFKGIVNSITKASNTIDRGTASEGQEINVTFSAPDKAWTATQKNELDIYMPIDDTNKALVDTWFTQVVTYDNAATTLVASA